MKLIAQSNKANINIKSIHKEDIDIIKYLGIE